MKNTPLWAWWLTIGFAVVFGYLLGSATKLLRRNRELGAPVREPKWKPERPRRRSVLVEQHHAPARGYDVLAEEQREGKIKLKEKT